MGNRKSLLLFADYFDATTATRRVVNALNENFDELEFVYWARLGYERDVNEVIFKNIPKKVYKETAPPRSLGVLVQFVKYQIWLLKTLLQKKPNMVIAFTFYTIFPALFYRLFINRKAKVIYDPRDYVAVSYRVNIVISSVIRFLDNLCMKLADFVIFQINNIFPITECLSFLKTNILFCPILQKTYMINWKTLISEHSIIFLLKSR